MSELVWRDPPSARRGRRRSPVLEESLRALKRWPGRWAFVRVSNASNGAAWFRRAGCDVTSRKREDGRFDIFARWPED